MEPFETITTLFHSEQEKKLIIRMRVRYKKPSLGTTVCHHSASLVMSKGDPRATLTRMIYSYIPKTVREYSQEMSQLQTRDLFMAT